MNDEDVNVKEKEISKHKCEFCGKEMIKGLTMHKKHCAKNPDNVESSTERTESSQEKKDDAEQSKEEPAAPIRNPIIITDIKLSGINDEIHDVAWFEDAAGNKTYKVPLYIGLLNNGYDCIPHLLVIASDGALIPPSMLPEFIGMYSKYHEFSDEPTTEDQKDEPNVEQPEIALNEPVKPIIEGDQQSQVITHAQEPEKKSFFARFFGKKEKRETEKGEMKPGISGETKKLLEKISLNQQSAI